MEKRSSKGLIALIIILIIVILGLVGYIVYDKVLLENEPVAELKDENAVNEEQNDISETEQVKELDKLEFESIDGKRQVYITEEGSVVCSDCNTVSFGNSKVIALEKASSCNGNYNIYMLADDGKVYVNKGISTDFIKIEPFEITTNEKIVDIESFDNSSTSCGSSNVALIGESGTKYYPMLECLETGDIISKVTLTTNKEEITPMGAICFK